MSITVAHVSKQFGAQPIIRDLSLRVETGELFVLLGASGSGKSTLLRMIAGLTPTDAGQILLSDRDVTHLPPQARGTGFVFQNYSLFRHMTVADNIAFGLSIRHIARAERDAKVEELLTLIGLSGYGDRRPAQLSGGQQQRVALARALAYQPNVLLLDEPFGALDVKIRAQLRASLREIQQRIGVTAVLVTHDQEEAFDIADRIGIIEKGELIEVGTPSQLYQRPQTRFTATFLGTANLLDGRRSGAQVVVGETALPAPPDCETLNGKTVQILCRPEEIALYADGTTAAAAGPIIGAGVVEGITFAGHAQRVTVRLRDDRARAPLLVALTPGESRALGLAVGQTVWLVVRSYHLLPT